jgi:hypothetical protein
MLSQVAISILTPGVGRYRAGAHGHAPLLIANLRPQLLHRRKSFTIVWVALQVRLIFL